MEKLKLEMQGEREREREWEEEGDLKWVLITMISLHSVIMIMSSHQGL